MGEAWVWEKAVGVEAWAEEEALEDEEEALGDEAREERVAPRLQQRRTGTGRLSTQPHWRRCCAALQHASQPQLTGFQQHRQQEGTEEEGRGRPVPHGRTAQSCALKPLRFT